MVNIILKYSDEWLLSEAIEIEEDCVIVQNMPTTFRCGMIQLLRQLTN